MSKQKMISSYSVVLNWLLKNLSLDVEESWKQANGKCIIFSPLKNTFRLIEKNWSDHGVQIHHNISKGKGGWLGEKIWPDIVIKACQRSNVSCFVYWVL